MYWEDWEHERKCLGVVGSGGGLVVVVSCPLKAGCSEFAGK